MNSPQIVVVGAGPAGAAVAVALVRLGYRVGCVYSPRTFAAVEGVSSRTVAGLRAAGLNAAADTVSAPIPRSICWNGEHSAANVEHLVDRPTFDDALLGDLLAAGVELQRARVRSVSSDGARVRIVADADGASLTIEADLVVDARGRSAPRGGGERLRGPESLSLCCRVDGKPREPGVHLDAGKPGWMWSASDGNGLAYLQMCIDARDAEIDGGRLDASMRELLEAFAVDDFQQLDLKPGAVFARGCTSVLSGALYEDRILRVGDAAMAVDPLSGNGIFQSLSSASVAPAVINTVLQRPQDAELAISFYGQRVRHIFERFARTGREFYEMETRYADAAFWASRRIWPDQMPSHLSPGYLGIAPRPVVADGFIVERDVVLTRDQPLGIWQVAGIELAPLIRSGLVEHSASAGLEAWLEEKGIADPRARRQLADWARLNLVAP